VKLGVSGSSQHLGYPFWPVGAGQRTTGEHQAYFEDQCTRSIPEFWSRFGDTPEFDGKRILDLGCGHGAMSLQMSEAGGHVLGVDLNENRIRYAQEHVQPRATRGTVEFRTVDVRSLDGPFDLIVSKDTFEHVEELPSVLSALRRQLAPGGQLWAGFSPLYYSPYGDHRRTGMRLPWAHTIPRPIVYARASRYRGHPVHSLADIGLNGMTPEQFRQWVIDAGLQFQSLRYNAGDKKLMPLLARLRKIPALEKYATVSVYAVMTPRD
jgi:SAM-dependent methyltransferase